MTTLPLLTKQYFMEELYSIVSENLLYFHRIILQQKHNKIADNSTNNQNILKILKIQTISFQDTLKQHQKIKTILCYIQYIAPDHDTSREASPYTHTYEKKTPTIK